MQIIWGGLANPEINDGIAEFVAMLTDATGFGRCTSLGVIADGMLIAGIVYHNWAPNAGVIEISGASTERRWLTRPVLKAMFSYPFLEIGCQTVVMRVSERNKMWNGRGLHRILSAYGFKQFRIPRIRGRDEAEIVHTLSDDDWMANGFHKELWQ